MARAPRRSKATPAAETQPAQPLAVARFVRPHRHAGKDYAVGDELKVDAATLELLARFGAVELGKAG